MQRLKRAISALVLGTTLGAAFLPNTAQAQTKAPERPTQADLLNRAQLEKTKAAIESLRAGRPQLPAPDIQQRTPLPNGTTGEPQFKPYLQPLPQPAQTRSDDLKPIIAAVIKEFEKNLAQARPGKPIYLLFAENDHESITQKLVLQGVTQHFKQLGDKRGFKTLYAFEQPHNDLMRLTQNYADRVNPAKKLSAEWTQEVDPDGSETLKAFLAYSKASEGAFSHANLLAFMHDNGIYSKGVDAARDGVIADFSDPETRKMGLEYFKGQLPQNLSLKAREGSFFRNYMMADQMQREAGRLQASVVIGNIGNAHADDGQADPRWRSVQSYLRAQGATVLIADFDTDGSYAFRQMIQNPKDRMVVLVPDVGFKKDTAAEIVATEKYCAKLPDLKHCFNKNALNDPYKQHVISRLQQWIPRAEMRAP